MWISKQFNWYQINGIIYEPMHSEAGYPMECCNAQHSLHTRIAGFEDKQRHGEKQESTGRGNR